MLPEKMLKVEVVTLKSQVEQVVRTLHEAGLVHLVVDKESGEWVKGASPLRKMDMLSQDASLLRDVISIGKKIGVWSGKEGKYSRADLQEIVGLYGEINDAQRIVEELSKKMESVEILRKLRINRLPSSQKVHYEIFECAPAKVSHVVIACERKGLDFEYSKGEKEAYIIIAGSSADKESIREIAKEFGLLPIKINEGIANVKEEIRKIGDARRAAERRAADAKEKIRKKLALIMGSITRDYARLQVEIERANAVLKFGESERLYFIRGWIRERDKEQLERVMAAHRDYTGMSIEKPHHGELPPTALKTPAPLKPFESLLRFISTPRSDEIDPTNLIAITLPIMFGIIVGDVGYSLVLLLLSAYYMNKMRGILGDLMKVIFISSFWGVLWGIVFCEFFGFEFEFTLFGTQFPLINRLHGVVSLLLLTIGIGALHIMLGNLLGMIEGVMHKEWKHAIAKACWVVLEIGLVVMAVDLGMGAAAAVLAVIGIVITEGVIGLIEIPGMVANIMSYARLAAVGLSGVILALLINMMRPDPSQGILMVVTIVMFSVAHLVAIGLAAFESLIQGGRLHAVEFFSKFFKGGGVPFSPFRMVDTHGVEPREKR
ncbi:MAG: V-type ATPase 116kDa subunit family protein [Candidatus Micrarchaeia archaeon]